MYSVKYIAYRSQGSPDVSPLSVPNVERLMPRQTQALMIAVKKNTPAKEKRKKRDYPETKQVTTTALVPSSISLVSFSVLSHSLPFLNDDANHDSERGSHKSPQSYRHTFSSRYPTVFTHSLVSFILDHGCLLPSNNSALLPADLPLQLMMTLCTTFRLSLVHHVPLNPRTLTLEHQPTTRT